MKSTGPIVLGFALLSCIACEPQLQGTATVVPARPPQQAPSGVVGNHGMVVTAHPEASRIGLAVLKSGGNAIDAAVAVQFALAVCFPYAGNIGGGGFLLCHMADGEVQALDFRETAPALAHRDLYLDKKGEVIPGLSAAGILSAGIPGSVDGMVQAHTRYGSLPWPELLDPAIRLARQGYPLTQHDADWLNKTQADFHLHNPNGGHYLVQAKPWAVGDTARQEDLARTLERVRDQGRAGFYAGETARLLLDEMARAGGIIQQTDLDSYHALWREPLVGSFQGDMIYTMPPPSSGGLLLLQALGMLEPYPLAEWGPDDPRSIHVMVEALRRAFADRATHVGDPAFWNVPKGLLDSAYLAGRMADFDPAHATPSSQVSAGQPAGAESNETTHFSIIDEAGNAVSVTTTVNGPFGSKVWVDGAGFLLNNEMDDFSAKPGSPNIYGLTGNAANAIAPGKRMLSSMTPTIVTRQGKVVLVLGTPGGSTIPVSVLQCLLRMRVHGANADQAVRHARFHHQWLPDEIAVEEDAFPTATWEALRKMGHQVCLREPIGRVDAVLRHPDGRLEGGADPRRDDQAAGW
jgi:gamma-glutamyltranspeptidase/glutathione hydrolase